MKKFILFIMVLISINTYAQNIRLGFTTGVAISNYQIKIDGNKESASAKAGLTVGVLVDITAGKHFSFQPGLNFVQKGTKDETTNAGITEKVTLNVNHIELPLNVLYNIRAKAGKIFIGAGPSFTLAVSGKAKYTDGTTTMSETVKFGNGDDDLMKSFDMGANFLTGFNLNNGFMFSVNYNLGLSNLFPHGSDDGTLRSSYFGIKLGYLLGGKRK